jgi:hypothetical protein
MHTQYRMKYSLPGSRGDSSITMSSTHYFMKLTAAGVKAGDTATSVANCEWEGRLI